MTGRFDRFPDGRIDRPTRERSPLVGPVLYLGRTVPTKPDPDTLPKHAPAGPDMIRFMHGFWRATIGIATDCVLAGLSVTRLEWLFKSITDWIVEGLGGTTRGSSWQTGVGVSLGYFLPALLLAFIVYGLLTLRAMRGEQLPTETRCRKCGYILRGITEPRCPECGERI